MSETTPSTIRSMCAALRNLETIPTIHQSPEYSKICNDIKHYISTNCNHKIVSDLVDVNWDRSQPIRYCIHCETTFS